MDSVDRAAVLLSLCAHLNEHGSWCGEIHVQKATYLQQRLQTSLGFDFVMYRHGPFSFDLRDELTGLRSDGYLTLNHPSPTYGPRLVLTERGRTLVERESAAIRPFRGQLEFVAKTVNGRGVAELERLTTALWVLENAGGSVADSELAVQVRALKPHIPLDSAVEAIAEVRAIQKQATVVSPVTAA